jgi:osmotically-inducible protein OsmY
MQKMTIFYRFFFLVATSASLWSLSGCQSLSVLSSPIQKRGVSGFFKDNLLHAKITKALFRQHKGSVTPLIHKGRVMLVGYVNSKIDHQNVLTKLEKLSEIKRLDDYLVIGTAPDNALNDTYLSQSLQSSLFFDTRISSQNYHITASHKILYIIGTARSESEKQHVLKHAESMKVRRVISDILIDQSAEQTALLMD